MSRRHRRGIALPKLSGAVRTGNASHNRELKLEELKLQELQQMSSEAQRHFDVLVIGGGPAGMAAAARAAECGVRVGIVDDNFGLGGQIWRSHSDDNQKHDKPSDAQRGEAARWANRVRISGVTALCELRVVHQPETGVLLAENLHGFCELTYANLILATGARERFLPFPGWTLPNVMGAGGLQAMVKCGLPIRGKRVIIAGTGPLLLAVAAYLRQQGARIPIICEQASWARLASFSMALLAQPNKIVQALKWRRQLAAARFSPNSWPVAAQGGAAVQSVTISRSGKLETMPCDYLACGF